MKRIKELRKEKRMTQIAMQLATGIDQALLSKFESGERVPPTETLVIIADFFNVSTDYLLERTDNREINQ
ncbi:MAG: helix-turn-helix domain-containing protein [Clostridia bacterium]|nr:helix-turn-helix domain-containing protein [Clostridia bacterium]